MSASPESTLSGSPWKEASLLGVAAMMINLIDKHLRPYLGDWKNQVIKERRSDAYLKLVQE